ncbi:hypothetical protein MTR67_007295 [Solanum verrucosum]|uniref:Gag-pol polyprotein n=1 Tax=Solanum verrucosum TaxID=315347 RepID=A0AAF0Q1S9_SOLVR|nr:hypothetical protein MTR67_007295 [Solanum verrucosum]
MMARFSEHCLSKAIIAFTKGDPQIVGGVCGWPPATPSSEPQKNSIEFRPTLGPTNRRSDHCLWSKSWFRTLRSSPRPQTTAYQDGPFMSSASRSRVDRFPLPFSSFSVAARVRDFFRMNPPEILGSQVGEDPQNFIDEVKKIFGVIQVTRNDRVELASYQLKDVANIWFMQWKDNMGDNASLVTWECFTGGFLDRYAPHVVVDSRVQMSKFLFGVSDLDLRTVGQTMVCGPGCSSNPSGSSPICQMMADQDRPYVSRRSVSQARRWPQQFLSQGSFGFSLSNSEQKRRKSRPNPSPRTQQVFISSIPEIERFLREICHQVQVFSIQITRRSVPAPFQQLQ